MPLTIGLSILVSGAFGSVQVSEPPAPAPVVKPALSSKAAARAAIAGAVMASPANPEVKQRVQEYFADIPIMVRIAGCESKFHQHDHTGNVLTSVTNDLGVMQINVLAHSETAQKLGYDLTNIEDNMAYARMLYNQSGTTPWNSSAKCWAPKRTVASAEMPMQPIALESVKTQE